MRSEGTRIEDELAGESEAMGRLRSELLQVAPLASTVLLTGETGTGKGQAARALHRLSPRAAEPFVHVDCAALSPALIESELFGHERGSFTDAATQHTGRFELAGRGSLFLDEIGELEPRLQSKLLRVLDDRAFERVGGTRTLRMRARVIAATRHDLREAVQAGRFRPDLYFRLSVFHFFIPPLRERPADIAPLVGEGLARLERRLGRPLPRPPKSFRARLGQHSWPGNVRELLNVLERVYTRWTAAEQPEAFLDAVLEQTGLPAPAKSTPDLMGRLIDLERREILEALRSSRGNVAGAARRLRMPRSTLRHRMRRLGLDRGCAAPGSRARGLPDCTKPCNE